MDCSPANREEFEAFEELASLKSLGLDRRDSFVLDKVSSIWALISLLDIHWIHESVLR